MRLQFAVKLRDLEKEGMLRVYEHEQAGRDISEIVALVAGVKERGLLPKAGGVGVDARGIIGLKNALIEQANLPEGCVLDIPQGWKLSPFIQDLERRCAQKTFAHEGSGLMAWAVGNARAKKVGNAVAINKENAVDKIDPLAATLNAAAIMSLNPKAAGQRRPMRISAIQ